MSGDVSRRVVFGVAFAIVFCGLIFLWRADMPHTETQRAKEAAESAQTATNNSKQQYLTKKEQNIRREEEVGQNAYEKACEDCSTDADAVIAWAELVSRARESNGQRYGGGGKR